MDVLNIKNLSYSYKKSDKCILSDINLNHKKGEVYGLLGPSGAGKTTVIRLITGQLACKPGEISLLEKDVSRLENEMFSETGMKQRLSLVRAVLHKPSIVFLDEPTSGLDPLTAEVIRTLIIDLKNEGMTIFLTTHNMAEATMLCDKIGLLYKGKMIENGTPAAIKQKYWKNDNVKITYYDNKEEILSLGKDYNKIQTAVESKNIASIHSMEPTLEDVFKKVVGGK